MKNLLIAVFLFGALNTIFSQSPGVTDIDGNTYDTIHWNGYAIMVDMLKVTHFNDGEEIPYVKKDKDWAEACKTNGGYPAYCYLDNKKKNQEEFGNLYNVHCIENNAERIAPEGWYIPTYDEWVTAFGQENYELETTAHLREWHKSRKVPIEITKNNRVEWAFDLQGGGFRQDYTGKFLVPDYSYFHLVGGGVTVSTKAEAKNNPMRNSYGVICVKKLQ